MKEGLALIFGRPEPLVTPAAVEAPLKRGDYAQCLAEMWLAGAQIIRGELDLPLSHLREWLEALPAPWSEDARARYLTAWMLHDQRRNTLALHLLDALVEEWRPRAEGSEAAGARRWCMLLAAAQGTVAEAEGRHDMARRAHAHVLHNLPPVPDHHGDGLVLTFDPGEMERLRGKDRSGLCRLIEATTPVFQAYGDRSGLSRVAHNLGHLYLDLEEPAGARYWLEQALELKRGQPGRFPLTFTLDSLGVCYRQLGMVEKARDLLDEALRIATYLGSPALQATILTDLGDTYRDQEEFASATDLYQKALALQGQSMDTYGMACTQLSLSVLHRRTGHAGLAADAAAEARTLSYGHGDELFLVKAELHELAAAVLLGDGDAAEPLCAVAGRLAAAGAPRSEALARWYMALARYRQGDQEGALSLVRQAVTVAARSRHLSALALELPVTAEACRTACPELLAGLVQRAAPRGLMVLLRAYPEARTVVEAAGRMPETTALSVHLLGGFRLERAGRELDLGAARSQKAVSLFKYLVAQRGRLAAREQILEAIWPEADPESADRSFEVTLSTLRRLVDLPGCPTLIIRRGRGYQLNPDVPVMLDVDRFARRLERGNWWWQRGQHDLAVTEWEAAEAAYGGDFLADDPYEDWATAERERLREQYLDLVLRLGEMALQAGRCGEALERAYRVMAADPIREAAYRLLMRAHARQGNRAAAVRDLQRCSDMLRRELGEEPMPETRELARRIRTGEYQ